MDFSYESARLLKAIKTLQAKAEKSVNPLEKMKLAGEAVDSSLRLAELNVVQIDFLTREVEAMKNGK